MGARYRVHPVLGGQRLDRARVPGRAGERLVEAEERHDHYFREHPTENDRDWILAAIAHLAAAHQTAAGLFDKRHNPLWELTPSFEAATALIAFWRRRDDAGDIRYDFTDWDTRFLGDLYQDLSEAARKAYALLQTPEFVEEFILDLTLNPAIEEFGLDGLRTIDPACGSGHFLLGSFRRILAAWRRQEPGTNDWELIRRSLASVHGCDKNPFATMIARFRLMIAALHAGGTRQYSRAPSFSVDVAVGDSLLHGRGIAGKQNELFRLSPHVYAYEDVNDFVRSCDLLDRGTYHVVVGNPPYITVKDRSENRAYRDRYGSCSGTYALSVPFVERMFQLAVRTAGSDSAAGYVGQITANSFMKREFGKKLIERYLPTVHLTHIIDSSGAYIPGHGTPTVILVGRNHLGRAGSPIRAVLGVRGEPGFPADASRGLVWTAIVRQVNFRQPYPLDDESTWVTVEDVPRARFAEFPWRVSGGGAAELQEDMERASTEVLGDCIESAGFMAVTRANEVYFADPATGRRKFAGQSRQVGQGSVLRDWSRSVDEVALFPYGQDGRAALSSQLQRLIWPYRPIMLVRAGLSGTQVERGLQWYEFSDFKAHRWQSSLKIAFPFVATGNHFVLERQGAVYIQTAPVIKLPRGASEDDHLALLGVLNSSSACFWLKQVSQAKAGGGTGRGMQDEGWEERYEFTGTKLQTFPLPLIFPFRWAVSWTASPDRWARPSQLPYANAVFRFGRTST